MLLDAQDDHAGHACGCAGHCARPPRRGEPGAWSAIAPALACAACPACLTTYGKVLAALGVGVGSSELQHVVVLGVALAASLAVSAWRSWRTRRAWPIGVASSGTALVLVGHLADVHLIEWAGVLVLIGGGLTERAGLRGRRLQGLRASD